MAENPETLAPESDDARIARGPADGPSDGAESGAESDGALRVLHKRLVQLRWDALHELEDRQGQVSAGAAHDAPAARERKPLIRWPSLSLEHYRAYRRQPNAVRLDHVFRLVRPAIAFWTSVAGSGTYPELSFATVRCHTTAASIRGVIGSRPRAKWRR